MSRFFRLRAKLADFILGGEDNDMKYSTACFYAYMLWRCTDSVTIEFGEDLEMTCTLKRQEPEKPDKKE